MSLSTLGEIKKQQQPNLHKGDGLNKYLRHFPSPHQPGLQTLQVLAATEQLGRGRIFSAEGQWHTQQNEAKQRTGDWKKKKKGGKEQYLHIVLLHNTHFYPAWKLMTALINCSTVMNSPLHTAQASWSHFSPLVLSSKKLYSSRLRRPFPSKSRVSNISNKAALREEKGQTISISFHCLITLPRPVQSV